MPNDKQTLKKAIDLYELKGIHPAADLFPLMEGEDYENLFLSVKDRGFLEPVIVDDDGMVIDGRNRLCVSLDLSLDAPVEVRNPNNKLLYVLDKNLNRRHLTTGQRAMIGTSIEEYYSREAKERQIQAGKEHGRGKQEKVRGNSPKPIDEPRPRKKAASAVNVNERTIQEAKTVKQSAPDIAEEVQQGRSLHSAYTETKEREAVRPPVDPKPKPTPKQETIALYDYKGNRFDVNKTKGKATFNRTNDAIQWAWWTWNPITGCNHGCYYCYARELTNNPTFKHSFPAGFTPLFREDRIQAPQNTEMPNDERPEAKRVFVCSMSDMFGDWVPSEWIEKILKTTKQANWQYLYLTKNPERYKEFDIPENSWIGTTVSNQEQAENIGHLRQTKTKAIRWVSFEPLTENIEVDLTGIDWVVIGAMSGTIQNGQKIDGFAPEFEWVMKLIQQARRSNCSVYMKANLLGKTSDQWPGMKLIKEMPIRE